MFEDVDDHRPALLSYRQQNAARARGARTQRPGRRPPVLDAEVNKVKAARHLFADGLHTSLRYFSRSHDIQSTWSRRLLLAAGSVCLEEQREAFRRLLRETRDLVPRGDVRGALFTWWRSYDETPRLCRIDSMNADGTLESEAGSAKIMCVFCGSP